MAMVVAWLTVEYSMSPRDQVFYAYIWSPWLLGLVVDASMCYNLCQSHLINDDSNKSWNVPVRPF